MSVRTSTVRAASNSKRLKPVLAVGPTAAAIPSASMAHFFGPRPRLDESHEDGKSLFERLQPALQEALRQDAVAAAAAAEEQQQLEQRLWWQWVHAMREGRVPHPEDWQPTASTNPQTDAQWAPGVLTRAQTQQYRVTSSMPTLPQLRRAVLATHMLFLYLDRNSDTSDAWSYSWRAGDVNYVPYNHFDAINFMESNEVMIQKAVDLMLPSTRKLGSPEQLTPEERQFAQNWVVAREMLAKLGDLNAHARHWTQLPEYREWASPIEPT